MRYPKIIVRVTHSYFISSDVMAKRTTVRVMKKLRDKQDFQWLYDCWNEGAPVPDREGLYELYVDPDIGEFVFVRIKESE